MSLQIQRTIPVLRMLDVAKAREFYEGFLGFGVDWEHRFGENSPLYMQVSRAGMVLHLSEHYGDAVPGACVYFRVMGLAEFHAELIGKEYRYFRPGIETEDGSRCMNLIDPFGNKLRFDEEIRAAERMAGRGANIELVKSLYAAFLRRDVPFVVARLSPEFEIAQSTELPWGGHYQGVEGLQQFFGKLGAHLENAALPIERYLDAGNHVVAIGRTQGKVRATGKRFDVPLAHVWEIEGGKARRFRPFIDNPAMIELLGG